MNCSEFSEELQQLVESRGGSPSEAAEAHVSECSSCRQQWRDHVLLTVALRAWTPIANSPSLVDGVLDRLSTTSPKPLAKSGADSRRWLVVATAAACLFALFTIGITRRQDDRNLARSERSQPDLIAPVHPPANLNTNESVGVASSMVAVLEDLRTEYREIAEETRASAREFAVTIPSPNVSPWAEFVLPEVPGTQITTVQQPADTPPQGAVSVISRSISSQIGEAMDFLWVAVPDGVPKG